MTGLHECPHCLYRFETIEALYEHLEAGCPEQDTQLELFDLLPKTHARSGDPATSHAAARQLSDKTTMMRRLLVAFGSRAMTAEEAADACSFTAEEGAWKRVSDLANLGLIEDTGQTRQSRAGRAQVVRRITQEGWQVLT